MTTYSEFVHGTDWQQSSERPCHIKVPETDIWPIDDNSESQAKDALADGLHPVVAIGTRLLVADGRPNLPTGVVISYDATSLIAVVDICAGRIVRQYVSNIDGYPENGNPADSWEDEPAAWQPVYVDDSDDLGAGCTLSMSDTNEDGLANPLAGYLVYCQDEYYDYLIGGGQTDSTPFPLSWSNTETEEHLVCVLLTNATP